MLQILLCDICITIDIDPDGLSGKTTNRNAISFDSFKKLDSAFVNTLHEKLNEEVSVTWFVRIDNQIKDLKGSEFYLIEKYDKFWKKQMELKNEIAWHPHLYQLKRNIYTLIADEKEAIDLIFQLDSLIKNNKLPITSFRNGEGWITTNMVNLLESLNYEVDSSMIPNRINKEFIYKDFEHVDNVVFFPDFKNCRVNGDKRSILEIPMNTWHFKTSYDEQPKLRYLNPAVHNDYFVRGIDYLDKNWHKYSKNVVWVFISHPDEIISNLNTDLLYSHDINIFCKNLLLFKDFLMSKGKQVSFKTIESASSNYRGH